MLVVWVIWKHRNRCVFDNMLPQIQAIMREITEEMTLWTMAGAKRLGKLR